jgi:hypothetical protein
VAKAISASDKLDQELARSALEKQRAGQRPDHREQAALRRIERKREEDLRWQYYETIPQKHYVAMSGRQWKVLAEQAERHGLPITGRVLSLPRILRAFHDFLAAHKRALAASQGQDDPMMGGDESPALERYRGVRADQEELKLAAMRRELLPRQEIVAHLQRGQGIVRQAVEALQRQFGPEAAKLMNDAFEEAQRALDSLATDGPALAANPDPAAAPQ